jgi:hypothetical protein
VASASWSVGNDYPLPAGSLLGDASLRIDKGLILRRPSDMCRGLAVEDHTQKWREAPSETRPKGAPLTVILRGERMPGTEAEERVGAL